MNRRVIIFLVLIFCSAASLSCNIGSQIEAILCQWSGGTMVYNLEYHHGYCEEKSDSQPPGAEINTDPAKLEESKNTVEIPDTTSNNLDNLVLAGTYIGTTTINQQWINNWGGYSVRDEIIIEISQNGTVTGSVVSLWKSGEAEPIAWEAVPGGPIHNCVTEMSISETGPLSGRLTEQNNTIQIELTWNKEIKRYDCPAEHETQSGIDNWNAELSFAKDILYGTVPGQFTFEAQK